MTDNFGMVILQRLGAVIAANPWFWVIFLATFVLVAIASMMCFEKRWLRALVSASLAIECVWFLCVVHP